MTTLAFQKQTKTVFGLLGLLFVFNTVVISSSQGWADGDATTTTTSASQSGNTGGTANIGVFNNANTALNGSTNNGTINGNQNTLNAGQNTTYSGINTPSQAVSTGGTSALVLPRNPLSLPNANLGRSNFGLQFGLNNNPILGNLNTVNGKTDALSWFLQGGLTIPFGKIPDVIANPRNTQLDDIRQQRMQDEREVFGSMQNRNQQAAQTNVQGKVVRLNAYNYATSPSPRLEGVKEGLNTIEADKASLNSPKVLALADASVFSKPLGKGDKIGITTTGEEYRYIGHTNSGWVKIILSNGREGWVKGQFEYLKSDYTEIDTITLNNTLDSMKHAHTGSGSKLSLSSLKSKADIK